MKTFQTTCYARVKHLPRDSVQVQTSTTAPPWWKPVRSRFEHELAPESIVFKLANEKKDWRGAYRRQLERLFASGKLKQIVDRTPDQAVLLCYEADHCDCHRKVLAEFLVEKGLAKVSEFVAPMTKKEREASEESKQRVFL